MSTIPFEKQYLAVDPIEQIEHAIAQGSAVSGDELLRAWPETYQLDPRLRELLRKFSVASKKPRGRPRNSKGLEDFALEKLDGRYTELLRKFQDEADQRRRLAEAAGETLPAAQQTPSELAYKSILKEMQTEFLNISWEALRNKHSDWKNGHFHSPENHVDSEDFDAEIDRQFPATQGS